MRFTYRGEDLYPEREVRAQRAFSFGVGFVLGMVAGAALVVIGSLA